MDVVGILWFLVIGLVIGALARLLRRGAQDLSLVATMLLGVAGALIGGVVASLLGTGGLEELNVIGFVVAVIAAMVLIGVFEGRAGGRRRA